MTAAEESAHILKMWNKVMEWQERLHNSWRDDLWRFPIPDRVDFASRMTSLYQQRVTSAKRRQIMKTTP